MSVTQNMIDLELELAAQADAAGMPDKAARHRDEAKQLESMLDPEEQSLIDLQRKHDMRERKALMIANHKIRMYALDSETAGLKRTFDQGLARGNRTAKRELQRNGFGPIINGWDRLR